MLMIGAIIAGRYRIEELVGEGGIATVYKAVDTVLERPVAVKILKPEMAQQPELVARFRREAHAAAKLNHPNIVQIYDTGVEGDIHFIVMEYLPEPDLKRIIKEYAPLPERKVLEVGIQCARALAYAHKQGIVHRDVKPHNILFTDDGRVKLSDFGIAAALGEGGLTEAGLVLGSAYYISPEQAQGAPATAQSDIYSLGVVLFECITGRLPFTGATAAEIAARHVRERPPSLRALNPQISPSLEYVINKAMARELTRRYRTAEELLVDLEKIADGIELDRTGVLSPGSEEATLRLQPTQLPVGPPVAEPAPRPTPVPPTAPTVRLPQRSPGSAAALTALTAMIAIAALIGIFWLVKAAFYPGQAPKKVQVPSVKGMTLADATAVLQGAGLTIGKVTYAEDNTAPEGTVLSQTPEMGETVPAGTAVDLVIRRGKQIVTVPDIRRRTVAEARERLQGAGLQLGESEQIYHNEVPAGLIVKQAIPPGTKVEAGTAVDVTVSRGPEPPPTPPAVAPPPTEAPEEPHVEIRQVEDFPSANPNERKFVIKVTATGTQPAQKIRVLKSDDTGRSVEVGSSTLDPGASREWTVILQGNATIEVYHEGRLIFSEQYPLAVQP